MPVSPPLSLTDLAYIAKAITPPLADELEDRIVARLKIVMALGDDLVVPPREAGEVINKSMSTLESWRAKDIGPKWVKTGPRSVGYRIGDLKDYLQALASTTS
jgi:hypothetical protein